MLRNKLINALGITTLEIALINYLLERCNEDSTPEKVVTEVDSFLVRNRFTHLLTSLNPSVSLDDIVIDFKHTVVPCLVAVSNYKQDSQ